MPFYNKINEHVHNERRLPKIPKIIENLRERITAAGKRVLLESGYRALSIRGIAAECGIAAGTVYNYFPSKNDLVAAVMLTDWQEELVTARAAAEASSDCMSGLEAVYDSIRRYYIRYAAVWEESGSAPGSRSPYHPRLIAQLTSIIRPLILRFCPETFPEPSAFLAEVLMHAATRKDITFAAFEPYLQKLIR